MGPPRRGWDTGGASHVLGGPWTVLVVWDNPDFAINKSICQQQRWGVNCLVPWLYLGWEKLRPCSASLVPHIQPQGPGHPHALPPKTGL